MRGDDIDLRIDSSIRWGGKERRQVSRWVRHRKFQRGKLDRAVYAEHRGNNCIVKLYVLARRHSVDVVFVENAPPGNRMLWIAGNEGSSSPGETALVVILHQVRAVIGKSLHVCGVKNELACRRIIQKGRRHGDLKLRTVIRRTQHRLHN